MFISGTLEQADSPDLMPMEEHAEEEEEEEGEEEEEEERSRRGRIDGEKRKRRLKVSRWGGGGRCLLDIHYHLPSCS